MFYEGLKRGVEGICCGKVCTNVQKKYAALEDWAIWQRWEVAYHTGKADLRRNRYTGGNFH